MSLIEHLEKLRHFHRLTSYRSINSGAQAMGLSQAGLSKSISNLEAVLETKLFKRFNEGLVLTKEGELVLQAAKKIFDEAASVELKLRSLKAAKTPDNFIIGMYDSIAIYLYPALSAYIKEIYPAVNFGLIVDRSSNLEQMIVRSEIDLAIGVNFTNLGSSEFLQIFSDSYSFYCSPAAYDKSKDLPIIFHPYATDEKGKTIEQYLSTSKENRTFHRILNFETVKELTALGVGVGVLPLKVAEPMVAQKLLKQTRITKLPHQFGKHSVGLLVEGGVAKNHEAFVKDLQRLIVEWSKR